MIAPGITERRSRLGPVPTRNRSGARARMPGRILSYRRTRRLRGPMRLSEEDREGNELMGADAGCAFINAQCFGELWWQWRDDVESHVLGVGRRML